MDIIWVITTMANVRVRDGHPPGIFTVHQVLYQMSEDDLVGVASFYRSVVRPLVRECAACFLQNIENIDPSLVDDLSAMEKTRLLRALYRFQLWCNLFGNGPRASSHTLRPEPQHIWRFFFEPFLAWEVAEISCIYSVIYGVYNRVFKAITEQVFEIQPEAVSTKTAPWNPPTGKFDTEFTCLRNLRRSSYMPPSYPTINTMTDVFCSLAYTVM